MLLQPWEKMATNIEGIFQHATLRNKSIFNPPVSDNGHNEVFKKMMAQDLQTMELKKVKEAKVIEIGISHLENRKNMVIRPAGKGGGLVIQTKMYRAELNRQVEDNETYIPFKITFVQTIY